MKTSKKNTSKKKSSKYTTDDGHFYLTKRITVAKAQAAGRAAASDAMQVMGFVVVAENGKVVKKFPDGRREVIAVI